VPVKGVRVRFPPWVQNPPIFGGFCRLIRNMFYTYILQSLKSRRYYIGHSADIDERLERHNSGKVKATRNKGPWIVVYYEKYETKTEANSRELYIKSMKSRVYIEKLISDKN
jgi:putative endonuclease